MTLELQRKIKYHMLFAQVIKTKKIEFNSHQFTTLPSIQNAMLTAISSPWEL